MIRVPRIPIWKVESVVSRSCTTAAHNKIFDSLVWILKNCKRRRNSISENHKTLLITWIYWRGKKFFFFETFAGFAPPISRVRDSYTNQQTMRGSHSAQLFFGGSRFVLIRLIWADYYYFDSLCRGCFSLVFIFRLVLNSLSQISHLSLIWSFLSFFKLFIM